MTAAANKPPEHSVQDNATWFGQPRGLTILFLTEMWEKFSFFGMRALLVYYVTKELHYNQANASLIFGAYAAGVYLTPIFGGMIADRWLGRRRAVIIGGLLMAVGHFMMATESLFFPAMVVIAIGNGLFLPNLPSQVPLLYPQGDPRGASAFNVYYAGVNLGAFLAPLVCGTLGEVYGWHYGFGAAGIGMCLGLLIYIGGGRYLPSDQREAAAPVDAGERDGTRGNVLLLLSVAFAVMLFRSAYEQTGNTLALWVDASVDRAVLGRSIPVTWLQSLNPMFVFLISPILVGIWNRRAARGLAAPALRRMFIGALGVGLSYCLLAGVILFGPRQLGGISWIWLLMFFGLFTLGELYILPVGLGLFASLAPRRFGATTIAAWFLTSFAGNLLSGVIGAGWKFVSPETFFFAMAGICFVACALLLAIDHVHRRQAPNAANTSMPVDYASGTKRCPG
jgi:POT family proton-dependent oligopeptide transporter